MAAIWDVFVDTHMPYPNPEIIKKSAKKFFLNYGFPMVWGALDGKHFPIKNPEDGSKANFCYKRFYSINVQGYFEYFLFIKNYIYILIDSYCRFGL